MHCNSSDRGFGTEGRERMGNKDERKGDRHEYEGDGDGREGVSWVSQIMVVVASDRLSDMMLS